MSYAHPDSEQALENATMALFAQLGWQTADCFEETFGPNGTLGRETSAEVVLLPRLRAALEKLNPDVPAEALDLAIQELTGDRSAQSLAHANRELYQSLKDGVKVTVAGGSLAPRGRERAQGGRAQGPMLRDEGESIYTVRVIDWNTPANNDFFLASQFWVSGEMYKRRADLVGFVNGLPLVFAELKVAHKRLENAYRDNLRDYKVTIPHIFWYNAFIILSNGSHSKMGSLTAEWEHFADWHKITSEGETGIISLDTMIRGTCAPSRLLDIVENFILFNEVEGGLAKLVARNHQYLGVNNAIRAVQEIRPLKGISDQKQGRLGVFWHTQGSGKSYSMVFFAQKVMRKLPGNWTFVIVTDRQDLDDQIYKNFARVGAMTEPEDAVRADSGEHLRQLLREDHRYVFTLIHKFHTQKGQKYPVLSERSDIIVMPDEAHRTQYDVLALNMRNALPNAAFIAYTGTPLMAGEEKTRQVFGDYVSIYNFKQSADDGNTVPLYYENRIPELQLTNQDLNRDMERLLEVAELDEAQEARLEREFSREYHLITRDDRLDKIAEDIVLHFMGRGYLGKAMVVSVDKATAVRMYDKVQKHWKIHLAYLKAELEEFESGIAPHGRERAPGSMLQDRRAELEAKVKYMQETDMAVVVSQSQNEIEDLKKKGADITPHRKRMLTEDLDEKFKDPADRFRIVFVCAMWMTGFDVPCCSTIYLDKPMRNHTLMQTIARANRVFGEKVNGLIVDYIGVFRDLQRALAIYGSASGGGVQEGEWPVRAKGALIEQLRQAIAEARAFCVERSIDLDELQSAEGFQRVKLLEDAVEAILVNDESKRKFFALAGNVDRLFRAILPDLAANEFSLVRAALAVIADKMRSELPDVDISDVMSNVEVLLDRSVAAEPYVIRDRPGTYTFDLSRIDFPRLRRAFEQGHKRTEAEKLRGAINSRLRQMVRLNKSRMNYLEQFQRMIDDYNAGATNVDAFFAQLVSFAQNLNDEEQRGIREQLTDEELAMFDLLTRPELALSQPERERVKRVAQELLTTLKAERLVLDWRKRQQTRAMVRLAIEEALDKLPSIYTRDLYQQKCDAVYQHVYDSYYGEGRGIYPLAV